MRKKQAYSILINILPEKLILIKDCKKELLN